VSGFSESEPRTKLAAYLSSQWLRTTHLDQQLDLLRWDIERSGKLNCEVVKQSFFRKLVKLYHDRETVPYTKDTKGARHVWAVGEELASNIREKVCGVVNIDDTHWVGVVIDAAQSLFLYGDSIAGSNTELKSAIDWWIENHTSQQFVHQNLPITRQFDGYNCSIFAVNAVGCNALPERISLLETSTHADELRIETFICVANRDLQFVSRIYILSNF
jgi:hypothetical protein